MNIKKYIQTARGAAMTARAVAIAALAACTLNACTADDLALGTTDPRPDAGNQLKLTLDIPAMPAFDADAAANTRAVPGTPAKGNRIWQTGDQLLARIALQSSATAGTNKLFNLYCTLVMDASGNWNILADGSKPKDAKAILMVSSSSSTTYTDLSATAEKYLATDGTLTLPVDFGSATTYSVYLHYVPNEVWIENKDNNGEVINYIHALPVIADDGQPTMGNAAGSNERWQISKGNVSITAGATGINLDMPGSAWKAQTARLRIFATPGDEVTLTGENLIWSGYDDGTGQAYCAESRSTTVKADADGNAYFYVRWNASSQSSKTPKITVTLKSDLLTGGNEEVVFVKSMTNSDTPGDTVYSGDTRAINAWLNASLDGALKATAAGTFETAPAAGQTIWIVKKADTNVTDAHVITAVRNTLPSNEATDKAGTIDLTLIDVVEVPNLDDAFSNTGDSYNALKSISLPATTSIGSSAFKNCTQLVTLTFGKAITAWGVDVFNGATPGSITLTLAADQKAATGGGSTSAADFTGGTAFFPTGAGTNKNFCGYTFGEIKQAQ